MASLRLPRALSGRLSSITHNHRAFSTSPLTRSSWSPGPAPPRLPKEEQEIFENQLKQSAISGAFSQPKQPEPEAAPKRQTPQINQSPHSQPEDSQLSAKVNADGEGEELHPNVRRGAKPEFEGDVNPKTGEVGGPKNEPLRWGHLESGGDWSYNGRVTDF